MLLMLRKTLFVGVLLLLSLRPDTLVAGDAGQGESREHRSIGLLSVGPTQAKNRFLVIAGVHGNETLPPEFVRWIYGRVSAGKGPLASLGGGHGDVAFDFIPVVNPDGYFAGTRYNAVGVNLNRNFGMLWGISREPMGSKAFSEPESRFVRDLVLKNGYTAAADMHGYMNWVVGPSAPSQVKASKESIGIAQSASYLKWISVIRGGMSQLSLGYVFQTAGGLGDGGAFEDWCFWKGKTFAVSVEIRSADRFGGIANEDSFLRYEAFLASAFNGAMMIKNSTKTEVAINH